MQYNPDNSVFSNNIPYTLEASSNSPGGGGSTPYQVSPDVCVQK